MRGHHTKLAGTNKQTIGAAKNTSRNLKVSSRSTSTLDLVEKGNYKPFKFAHVLRGRLRIRAVVATYLPARLVED
jgi:hypothetical protein